MHRMTSVTAILLAAGRSQRFGESPKQLAHIGKSQTMIAHTYATLSQSSVDQIILVTGAEDGEIRKVLSLRNNDQVIFNSNYVEGMTGSIQAGLAKVQATDGLMIALADMPALTPQDYELLIEAFCQKGSVNHIIVPYFNHQHGHPVIFGAAFLNEIATHPASEGCFGVMKNNLQSVVKIKVPNANFITDIDTQEDLNNFRNRVE